MSTVVITTTLKEEIKLDNVVAFKCKRKKNTLSDSFDGLDLKSPRRLNEDDKKLESFVEEKLEKKYKLDFEFNSLTFLRIFSNKLEKNISLQLNMCIDTYWFICNDMKKIIKDEKDLTVEILKKKLFKILYDKINETHEGKSKDFYVSKSKELLKEFFRFKKSLIFHSK